MAFFRRVDSAPFFKNIVNDFGFIRFWTNRANFSDERDKRLRWTHRSHSSRPWRTHRSHSSRPCDGHTGHIQVVHDWHYLRIPLPTESEHAHSCLLAWLCFVTVSGLVAVCAGLLTYWLIGVCLLTIKHLVPLRAHGTALSSGWARSVCTAADRKKMGKGCWENIWWILGREVVAYISIVPYMSSKLFVIGGLIEQRHSRCSSPSTSLLECPRLTRGHHCLTNLPKKKA